MHYSHTPIWWSDTTKEKKRGWEPEWWSWRGFKKKKKNPLVSKPEEQNVATDRWDEKEGGISVCYFGASRTSRHICCVFWLFFISFYSSVLPSFLPPHPSLHWVQPHSARAFTAGCCCCRQFVCAPFFGCEAKSAILHPNLFFPSIAPPLSPLLPDWAVVLWLRNNLSECFSNKLSDKFQMSANLLSFGYFWKSRAEALIWSSGSSLVFCLGCD